MKLLEIDAKEIFRRNSLATPRGVMVEPGSSVPPGWTGPAAVKAQVLFGGRGKLGLVRLATEATLADEISAVRAGLAERYLPQLVMVEELAAPAAEYYICFRINDVDQCPELLFSLKGGVEVESNADAIRTLQIAPLDEIYAHKLVPFFRDCKVPSRQIGPLARFASQLYRVFCQEDADLIEINPLAVTAKGEFIALDGKVNLDDSATYRHPERAEWHSTTVRVGNMSELERKAQDAGLTFIELEGNVAILSGGAGLGMLVLDSIVDTGNRPANFVDAIGGSSQETFKRQVQLIFEHARRPEIEAIVTFFTLAATPLASIVNAIVEVIDVMPPPKPLIVGLLAGGPAEDIMSLKQAKELLGTRGILCVTELVDLMSALSELLPRDRRKGLPGNA